MIWLLRYWRWMWHANVRTERIEELPSWSGTDRLHKGENDNWVRMRCGITKSEIEKTLGWVPARRHKKGGLPAQRYNDIIKVACKCAYQGDRRTFCWLEFWLDTGCKPSCQAQWSGESMTAWIWNTIKHNAPASGFTNISTTIEIIELSFAGQFRNHLPLNHYMSEKSPFCRTA